jgi:hypothetical protein
MRKVHQWYPFKGGHQIVPRSIHQRPEDKPLISGDATWALIRRPLRILKKGNGGEP